MRHWKELRHRSRGPGRPAKYKMIASQDGPETLYLGRRASDRFGRIYDKFAESSKECYRDCLRYELELKNETARTVALLLDADSDHYTQLAARVAEFVRNRSLHINWPDTGDLSAQERTLQFRAELLDQSSWAFRKAAFVEKCVGPMARTFVRIGELQTLLDALGIADYVYVQPLVQVDQSERRKPLEVM